MKSPARRNVTRRVIGNPKPRSNIITLSVADSVPLAASTSTPAAWFPSCHETWIGYGCDSTISYGRTLKRGERMADCNAAPRATASSAFIVVDNTTFAPRISFNLRFTHPIRVEPPTISTEVKSLTVMPASANAALIGPAKRANNGAHKLS